MSWQKLLAPLLPAITLSLSPLYLHPFNLLSSFQLPCSLSLSLCSFWLAELLIANPTFSSLVHLNCFRISLLKLLQIHTSCQGVPTAGPALTSQQCLGVTQAGTLLFQLSANLSPPLLSSDLAAAPFPLSCDCLQIVYVCSRSCYIGQTNRLGYNWVLFRVRAAVRHLVLWDPLCQ